VKIISKETILPLFSLSELKLQKVWARLSDNFVGWQGPHWLVRENLNFPYMSSQKQSMMIKLWLQFFSDTVPLKGNHLKVYFTTQKSFAP
jgi:hypothetical protein